MKGSLIDITLALGFASAARNTSRPILPNPLIPRRTEDMLRYGFIIFLLKEYFSLREINLKYSVLIKSLDINIEFLSHEYM